MQEVAWNDDLNIFVENIDIQKKRIIEHINLIYQRYNEKADSRVVFELLSELGEASRMHFSTEEKIMRRLAYPELEEHRKLHKLYVTKVYNLRRFINDNKDCKRESFAFLANWLIEHIKNDDHRFAPYARLRIFIDQHKRNKRLR